METNGSAQQPTEEDDELESTAELPVLPGDDATGENARPTGAEGQPQEDSADQAWESDADSLPERVDEADDASAPKDGSESSAQPELDPEPTSALDADQEPDSDDALDATADLSDAVAREDTSELPVVRSLEEEPTAELPLIDAAAAKAGESDAADGGSQGNEPPVVVPDKGETSEVVSAATLTRDARRKRARRIGKVAAVVAVAAACYGGGVAYYSSHYFPRTAINGTDVSNATVEEAAADLASTGQDYELAASGAGFSLDLDADTVGYAVDGSSMANDARNQEQAMAWPVALLQAHDLSVPLAATYDDSALTQAVDEAVQSYNSSNMNASRAYIGYSYTDHEYQVMGKVSGTALSAQAVHDACADAISKGETQATIDDSMVRGATLDDCLELQQVAQVANTDANATISITVDGEEKWSLGDEIRGWVSVSHSKVVVNQGAIRTWATYYLAPRVDYSNDKTSHTLDVGSLVTTLVEHLEAGDTSAIEAPMNVTDR